LSGRAGSSPKVNREKEFDDLGRSAVIFVFYRTWNASQRQFHQTPSRKTRMFASDDREGTCEIGSANFEACARTPFHRHLDVVYVFQAEHRLIWPISRFTPLGLEEKPFLSQKSSQTSVDVTGSIALSSTI